MSFTKRLTGTWHQRQLWFPRFSGTAPLSGNVSAPLPLLYLKKYVHTSNYAFYVHTGDSNTHRAINIYNGIIFPSLNPAKCTPIIGPWTESTWSVQFYRTKLDATSLWCHKITSKYYEVGPENWHFIFIEMRPLPAYLRENFKSFLSGAFRIKFFIWRYCKYKEWASYFSAFMENELEWGSDKSSENRFTVHGICHIPHPSSFSHEHRKKDTHSLNVPRGNMGYGLLYTKGSNDERYSLPC